MKILSFFLSNFFFTFLSEILFYLMGAQGQRTNGRDGEMSVIKKYDVKDT